MITTYQQRVTKYEFCPNPFEPPFFSLANLLAHQYLSKALERPTSHWDGKLHGRSYLKFHSWLNDWLSPENEHHYYGYILTLLCACTSHVNPTHLPTHHDPAFLNSHLPSQSNVHLHMFFPLPGNSFPTYLPTKVILQVSVPTQSARSKLSLFP